MKPFNARVTPIFTAAIVASSALWLTPGALLGGQAAPGRGEAAERRPQGVVADQFIVTFHNNVTSPRDLANALGQWHGFTPRRTYQYALKGFAARMPASVAQALARDPDVAFVEPDVYAHTAQQTEQLSPTGVKRIGAAPNPSALDCSGVDIAIIDTGIDLDHPDLNVNALGSQNFIGNNTGSPDDDNGHGTHVAGIVAAKNNGIGVVGVCPGARLWAIKVLDSLGGGYFSDIIEGVDYVTANAGQIKVANMSLAGVGYLASFRTAIQNSVNAGVVYVVAAGNSAMDVYGANGRLDTASDYNAFLCAFLGVSCGDDFIPAAYPEVATISAMSDTDGDPGGLGGDPSANYGPDDSFATFSNFSNSVPTGPVNSPGGAIDLLMPGVDILSTFIGGGYAISSGTSMASPHAAGLAARYIAANGRANNAGGVYAIRQALINSGVAQNSSNGLSILNDRDVNWENIGWAGAPPPVLPAISINDVTLSEGNSGTTISFNFTVSLSPAASQNVTVNFATASGTATAGSDYVAIPVAPLTFSAGETTKTVTVQVNGDADFEPNETFFVNLSNATNAYIADSQGLGTINNDDVAPPAPVVVFTDSFEGSLATKWTQDNQNDWFRSSQRKKPGTSGRYSAEVDGLASDAALSSIAINLQGKQNATITFSWYIESGLDTGEYIAFDVSTDNGASWTQRAILRGNVDPENTWHNVTVDLISISQLKIRFRGTMSDSTEDANVDDVRVVAF
jgi:subtilisin family serine protease